MGYDSQKTPLGALSPLAIQRGYEALGTLSEAIAAGLGEEGSLDELISDYYTNIPHAVVSARDAITGALGLIVLTLAPLSRSLALHRLVARSFPESLTPPRSRRNVSSATLF